MSAVFFIVPPSNTVRRKEQGKTEMRKEQALRPSRALNSSLQPQAH